MVSDFACRMLVGLTLVFRLVGLFRDFSPAGGGTLHDNALMGPPAARRPGGLAFSRRD